jgi:hypothetical protein
MKQIALLAVALMMLAGCTTSTPHGQCIGLNGTENPAKVYEYNATNIVVGVIFMETIFVPVIVALDELKCPIADKSVSPQR